MAVNPRNKDLTLGCLLASLFAPSLGFAQTAPDSNPNWIIERARQLQARGQGESALELLKTARNANPREERLAVALAWTYLEANNEFWALKTATEYQTEHPPACAAKATAVWIHLKMANPDRADEILSEPGCDQTPELRARFGVLRALLAEQRRTPGAAARLAGDAALERRVYAEDAPLLDRLLRKYHPGRLPVLSGKVELAVGFTSNGLAGSPVDATTPESRGAALIVADTRVRAVLPTSRYLRPVVTAQLRLFELLGGPARDLSYEQPTARAGLMWGAASPRLLVSYALDAVRLHAGDRYQEGPIWYSQAHRTEWELEATRDLVVFGGVGARRFRDMARTRFEAEQGLATSWLAHPSLRVMVALSGRVQSAHADAYDLVGGTGLAELDWAVTPRLDLRVNLGLSADWYPRSAGYFAGSGNDRRYDWLTRSSLAAWFELVPGLGVGSSYEVSDRKSTAEAYTFVDHRLLVRLAWKFDANRLALLGPEHRAALGWSRSEARHPDDASRIQDLLRQDDAVRRGSSCLK